MPKILKIFLFFILFNIFPYACKKIVIPFRTVQNSNSNYILSLLHNQIYSKLSIGTPKQTVYIEISTEASLFAIDSYLINETFYSHKKSKSYKNNTISRYDEYNRIKEKNILNETFYFKDSIDKNNDNYKIYDNIMFNYVTDLKYGYTWEDYGYIDNNVNLISGIIGLQITRRYLYDENIILIKSLKNIEAIDKLTWSINYINENEGYLIFGEYPHQYNSSLEENPKKMNCIIIDYEFYWYFIFTDIKIGENKISYRIAEYAPQLGLIIGTSDYKDLISLYFDNFIKYNKCTLYEIEYKKNNYSYYECDQDININDFKPIVFIHKEFEYNFTLDKDDLFTDFNNKKYFLVIFPKKNYNNNRWVLGKPFIKKYNFAFDHEAKIILFYNNKNINEKKNTKDLLLYILIIVLGILIILLGIFVGKLLFENKKKKKANELEDNINEEYKDSEEIINDNSKERDNFNSENNNLGV